MPAPPMARSGRFAQRTNCKREKGRRKIPHYHLKESEANHRNPVRNRREGPQGSCPDRPENTQEPCAKISATAWCQHRAARKRAFLTSNTVRAARSVPAHVVRYSLEIKHSAQKELDALDDALFARIDAKVLALANNPRPPGCKKLRGFKDHGEFGKVTI